ncbi:MAG: arylamine N-acetyltransferase [Planctomycetia bacterium]|nr:arylamine N-acetyltransferase [Planctomycetia bacterium]
MQPIDPQQLNLDAYCKRVEYHGGLDTDLKTLADLHLAHATHIPFENIDVMLRRPIRLDLASLQAKLIDARRGGYCFEQNLLFAAVLEHLGFSVTLLTARVRFGTNRVIPRTHVTLAVEIGDQRWLADLGFGSCGLLVPIPLASGEYRQFEWTYRLVRESDLWVLRAPVGGAWLDLYAFGLEPQLPVDFEPANHYVSSHPDSRFVQTLTVQRVAPDRRLVLRNTELTTTTASGDMRRSIADDAEVLAVLASEFNLHLPTGTRLLPGRS